MGRDESDCAKMRRIEISILPLLILLLVPSERRVHPGGGRGVAVVDAQMEMQFQKCCGLGTTWATEGLRCEKFTGPVPGVPRVEQGLCLEAVDICCVRAYHDQQCKKGKADARAGLACVKNSPLASKTPGRGDYHRDCCEGCKLGILTGSMGQGCAFKTFSFGVPWDPAFLECCYESSSTTGMPTDFTNATWSTDPTNNTQSSSLSSSTFSSSSFSPSSSTSSMSSPLSSLSSPSSSSSSSPSSSSTSNTSPSDASSPTSYSPSIPTPKLDDICQLMKGLLCSDICIPTPGSYRCACREGFTLLEDEKTCRQDLPSDRCKGPNPCEQRCTDTGSAVICSCNPGYILADDKRSCTPQSTKQTQKTPKDQDEYSALCPSGYRYNASAEVCNDIDECEEELDTCGDEVCYNQPGGYSCARAPKPIPRRPPTSPLPASTDQKCVDGTRFVRNRGCVDVDECREVEDACSSNEECINTMGSYTCNCKPGFRRDNLTQACVDINECQLKNDCLPTQRCDNTIGSYSCTRFLPCGTGYTLNAATEICEDDDECILGSHDCGEGYHCRNTLGSYRCDRNPRGQQYQTRPYPPMETVTSPSSTSEAPTTEALTSLPRIECPRGFEPGSGGQCIDIDECRRQQSPCGRTQRCLNTMGSYRCVSRVICGNGFTFDSATGRCIDVDECSDGSQQCTPDQTCQNRIGGYVCVCPHGFAEGPNKDCVDIDECSVYGSNICGEHSRCENTPGSYRCICEEGFENVKGAPDGVCQDTDECKKIPGLCQHVCLNLWGSHRCGCELGYRLNADNRSCTDVDECSEYKDHNLCIGICENTPGSYACKCPDGYKLGADGRTCQDIDECAAGPVCRGRDEMCQNMRGTFRCNRINCPAGYHRDMDRKNRCVRSSRFCPSNDMACFRMPSHYSYNFITFVSMLPLPSTGQQELFTMRGTHLPGSIMQFSMALVDARAPPGVARATESCFALRKPGPTQAVLVLTRSIPGPQEIELDLSMEIYRNADFVGSAVAKLLIFVSQYEF